MHMAPPPRSVVSFVLIAIMVGIMLTNENFILKVTNWLVYPLIAILFGLTLYLIPHWNGAILREMPSAHDFVTTLWRQFPAASSRMRTISRKAVIRIGKSARRCGRQR